MRADCYDKPSSNPDPFGFPAGSAISRMLARNRWMQARRDVLVLIFGIIAFSVPGVTRAALVTWLLVRAVVLTWSMDGYALAFGVTALQLSFTLRRQRDRMTRAGMVHA